MPVAADAEWTFPPGYLDNTRPRRARDLIQKTRSIALRWAGEPRTALRWATTRPRLLSV